MRPSTSTTLARSLLPLAVACGALLAAPEVSAQTFAPVTKLSSSEGTPRLLGTVGARALYSFEVQGAPASLWATDGKVHERVFAGAAPGSIGASEAFGVVGGKFLFSYRDGLYATGGTSATTEKLASVGVRNDLYGGLSIVDAKRAYFARGGEVWTTDGTAAGTKLVRKLAWPSTRWARLPFVKAGTTTLFSLNAGAETADNGLWVVSPSSATNILPGRHSELDRACGPYAYLHSAAAPVGAGLARTDGTAAGTVHLADPQPSSSYPGPGVCVGSKYFVVADDRLYASDGTAAGTTVLRSGVAAHIVESGGLVYFTQRVDAPTAAVVLSRTDGTVAGTHELYRLPAVGAGDQLFVDLVSPTGARSVLATFERSSAPATSKSGFLVSDGTAVGTTERLVDGFAIGAGPHAEVGGKLYFWASDAASGIEPWVSDGTAPGTKRLQDIRPGTMGSGHKASAYADALFAADGQLFTLADDGAHGPQLMAARVAAAKGTTPPDEGGADAGLPSDGAGAVAEPRASEDDAPGGAADSAAPTSEGSGGCSATGAPSSRLAGLTLLAAACFASIARRRRASQPSSRGDHSAV